MQVCYFCERGLHSSFTPPRHLATEKKSGRERERGGGGERQNERQTGRQTKRERERERENSNTNGWGGGGGERDRERERGGRREVPFLGYLLQMSSPENTHMPKESFCVSISENASVCAFMLDSLSPALRLLTLCHPLPHRLYTEQNWKILTLKKT